MKVKTFNEFVQVDEKMGVSTAIYSHLKNFFKENEKGSFDDAKSYIKDKMEGWDLSKEDFEEMKSKMK